MNRNVSTIWAILLGLCIVVPSVVGQVIPEKPQISQGVVKSVDIHTKSFMFTVDGKDFRKWVSDATRYLVEGQSAEMEDVLRPGSHVVVTYSGSIATSVEMTVPDPDADSSSQE